MSQQIDISHLSPQELAQQRDAFQQELQGYDVAFQQLKMGRERFTASYNVLGQLKKEEAGSSAMIPLTSSLYVPGKLTSTEQVLVDVGTNYYVKKSCDSAQQTFERKITHITKTMQNAQDVMVKLEHNIQIISMLLQRKMADAQQQQGAQQ